MIAHATTRVSILRGTSTNEFGDEVDNDVVAASGIPASRNQISHRAKTESSSSERTVRKLTFRVPRGTNIQPGDRLGDERLGDICLVDSVKIENSYGVAMDLIVKATVVDAVEMPGVPVGTDFNPFTGYKVKRVDGPTDTVLVEHNFGYPHHTSVFVDGIQVAADITPLPNEDQPTSTLIEFEDPQVDIVIVVSL